MPQQAAIPGTHTLNRNTIRRDPTDPTLNTGRPGPESLPPTVTNEQRTKNKPSRSNILLATLNMNGRAHTQATSARNQISKWTQVHQLMRQKQISILCLQETHLNERHLSDIDQLFGKRIAVFASRNPRNPTTSAGIAFVINKERLHPDQTQHTEIVPGRASLLSIKWTNDSTLTVLNIYAPNAPQHHPAFWENIHRRLRELQIDNVDVILGDFNITEDLFDRAPARHDDYNAIEALRNFRELHDACDAWRHDHPDTRAFIFTSNIHSTSRLDRIYVRRNLTHMLSNWEIVDTIIPSDHKMVLTRFSPPGLPFIGEGRWTMPLALLSNQELMDEITAMGIELQNELKKITPQDRHTPQLRWLDFKRQITTTLKRSARKQTAKISNKLKALEKDMHAIEQKEDLDSNDGLRTQLAFLRQEYRHLNQKITRNERAKAQARWFEKGEQINKYWTKLHNPRKPRDIIHALHDPELNRVTTKSSDMAEIARRYHNGLQSRSLLDHSDPERQTAIKEVLQQIPETQKFNDPTAALNDLINQDQVMAALHSSKNGTATGLDGLPYELWKALHDRHVQKVKQNKPSFNIIKCLTQVYNDIQLHGALEEVNFSIGWMCPLYKKKDRTKIENYRPITLLNTDYKIMTKTLATQLATHACTLLHQDQSGFVPARSIFDPIRLAETMCAYADYMEENGAIVALDQEKAYDKIDHKYLLDTLRVFRLPDLFVNTVATLYRHAKTQIIINGVCSNTYLVTRGVRQGDPLSCLLFNLAIEPLAAYIRNTPNLTGYDIPNTNKTVKVNLYADDTTVYLSEEDRYSDLESILKIWCTASGAKFNLEKTEIIPIGTAEHRKRVIESRQIHPDDPPLPLGIRIAPDGHPTRILGAWIGNRVENAQPWTPIIDKMKERLDLWARSRPTLDAKRLIIQMVVGGMSQFLTQAQGMPSVVLKSIQTLIRNFLWNGKTTPPGMSFRNLTKPRAEGGIGLLDIEVRNQAIDLVWLKTYIDRSDKRPLWTFAIDAIINCINNDGINTPNDIHTFLTTLRPSGRPKRNGKQPPRPLIALLQAAKNSNLTFASRKLSKALKRQMPAWYHIGVPPKLYHKTRTRCLRTTHKAIHMKDLTRICRRLNRINSSHLPLPHCACSGCRRDRNLGCRDPHRCATVARSITGLTADKYNIINHPKKDHLTLTHRRLEKNNKAAIDKGDEITFDPTVTNRKSLDECFRVLGNGATDLIAPAYRLINPRREQGQMVEPLTIYTDGSCLRNGKLDAACGSGVWFGDGDPRNKAVKVPGTNQSNQIGEIAAVTVALHQADPTLPVTIVTDSRYVIEGLTKHLSNWEDIGWTNISNAEWFKAAAYQLRRRAAPTSFKWVKGHAQSLGNERADELANHGARKERADPINCEVPASFCLPGIKLTTITQRTAYNAIRLRRPTEYTRNTLIHLDITRYAVQEATGHLETDATLWKNLRHPDIRRPIQNFLYRAMTGSLRIGEFWEHIPNYEMRATCAHCRDTTESLEHILTECDTEETSHIWNLVKDAWPEPTTNWRPPPLGCIIGCGSLLPPANEPDEHRPKQNGVARLKRILISESAYLIWSLRCSRVIEGTTHPRAAITTQWRNAITARLDIDRRLASANRKQYTKTKILHTWSPIIDNLDTLPHDWTTNLEVLVGIKLPRPPV